MDPIKLNDLLRDVADGKISPLEASDKLKTLPYNDIGFAKLDMHRKLRTGHEEVIFGLGKTPEQVAKIMKELSSQNTTIISTKVEDKHYSAVAELFKDSAECIEIEYNDGKDYLDLARDITYALAKDTLVYFKDARLIVFKKKEELSADTDISRQDKSKNKFTVAVLSAGTADIPIAEEAALTAGLYGLNVLRHYDVGVAGIHRLLDKVEEIRKADVLIVVAGMEGALASVAGGLVNVPVIAVPTSIGYGVSIGGLTALFSMLNSCSLGVSVVNIDNGFGAGHLASLMLEKR